MNDARPVKVAIIGGGCAAMATAFELTRPQHQGRYQVTVYQLGWRLGGKGASGRGPADRIEEHGLHLWMGFYENAFRLMRECYAELNRDPACCPIASWTDAFAPAPFAGVTDRTSNGEWSVWKGSLPPTDGLPGDPPTGAQRWGVADYMLRSVVLLRTLFEAIQQNDAAAATVSADATDRGAAAPNAVLEGIARLLQYGELATLASLIQAVGFLEMAIGSLSLYPETLVTRFIDAITSNARTILESRLDRDIGLRRLWNIIDLTLATIRGGIRFGLLTDPRGFDAVDDYDSREWLRLNGASESALDSGWIRALYDFGFSYENGDVTRPRISAGQALRSMLRAFFTYRGAFFWRMQAGMGDIVFAPFYEVLKRRGVRFAFFHRLQNVTLADPARLQPGESPYVEALEFDVQANIKGAEEYQPLVNIRGLPCWPSQPDFDQLVDGERWAREGRDFESHWDSRKAGSKTLRVIADFDFVVLGVGLGAVPYVCKELVARDPRWRAMVDHVQTVATQAFQIWMSTGMQELGWTDPPITISGFVEPFDTWADMAHLIPREGWHHPPRALAYFCSVLSDLDSHGHERGYPTAQRERVRENAIRFLNRDVRHLWAGAMRASGEFKWEVLVDPNESETSTSHTSNEARFATQFWTANVNPSDRYALSLPGSSAYRISPLDRTYDNLTIAGDWTDCGFNAGCVEAAVMSGRLAAHALCQSPALDDIVGFDHP
jgi:uncharacterized protein with NAD-binding domain and iron-sulfur cluster